MHSWTRFLFQLWPVIVVKLYTAMLLLNVDSATQDPVTLRKMYRLTSFLMRVNSESGANQRGPFQ